MPVLYRWSLESADTWTSKVDKTNPSVHPFFINWSLSRFPQLNGHNNLSFLPMLLELPQGFLVSANAAQCNEVLILVQAMSYHLHFR